MLARIVNVLLLVLLMAQAVAAGHPTTIGEKGRDGYHGHDWVAASRALRAGGSARNGLGTIVKKHLDWQSMHGVSDHGLEDGVPVQTQEFCAPRYPWFPKGSPSLGQSRFDLMLLLSEVVVTAEVGEAIPGFDPDGSPYVLYPLSNVVPLHGSSPVPGYVLVPVDRMVYRGRVYCRPDHRRWRDGEWSPPAAGDRVALIGQWTHGGIVTTGMAGGAMALIEDGEDLTWVLPGMARFTKGVAAAPGSAPALQARVDEAVAGGLLDLTAHLQRQRWGSPERWEFVRTWRRLNDDVCRVAAAAIREGRIVPTHRVCRLPLTKSPASDSTGAVSPQGAEEQ